MITALSLKNLANKPIINLIAYQAAWFACLFSAAMGQPWIGSLTAIAIVVWHLSAAENLGKEFTLICLSGIIGFLWESALVRLEYINYESGNWLDGFSPHWIVALWLVFATTFNISLKWFKSHKLLVSLLGLLGGPLAFYAGQQLGALTLKPTIGLIAVGVGWVLLMPLLMWLAESFNGMIPSK